MNAVSFRQQEFHRCGDAALDQPSPRIPLVDHKVVVLDVIDKGCLVQLCQYKRKTLLRGIFSFIPAMGLDPLVKEKFLVGG